EVGQGERLLGLRVELGQWGSGGGARFTVITAPGSWIHSAFLSEAPLSSRRRSSRLSATDTEEITVPTVKRPIVLKKIRPQSKALAEAVKENVCEGPVVTGRGAEGRVTPSLPLTASPTNREPLRSPPSELPDQLSARKVRRSYSRLSPFGTQIGNSSDGSDTSTPDPRHPARRSFFGFERLLHAKPGPPVSPVKAGSPREASPSFTTPATQQMTGGVPGVPDAKEKRRKRKVAPIETSTMDQWAAEMNATFAEAERFDLLVE
ncbi:sororin, partial [Leucoraja erinacea]|uniref:sororin n=1 Tax=Leucoraja erinaceus TaxID=7782 RepID=UPI002456A6AD